MDRERARQWHIQYDGIDENHSFLADPATLRPFDADLVRLELMLDNAVTRHETYLARLAKEDAARAAEEAALARAKTDELTRATEELEQRAHDQQTLAEERGRRAAERDRAVDQAQARVAELERALGREEGRRQELERRLIETEGDQKTSR